MSEVILSSYSRYVLKESAAWDNDKKDGSRIDPEVMDSSASQVQLVSSKHGKYWLTRND